MFGTISLNLSHRKLNLNPVQQMGYTFLPCVLAGLSNAPQYVVKNFKSLDMGCISANDVDSVILPADACGGDGVLAFANSKMNKVNIYSVSVPTFLFKCLVEFEKSIWFGIRMICSHHLEPKYIIILYH